MKQVGAVECLAVGLVESYNVLLTSEYFYLCRDYIILNTTRHISTIYYIISTMTSFATSGPLLVKFPCLVTETLVLVSNVMASFVSVFLNMMYGIQTLSI